MCCPPVTTRRHKSLAFYVRVMEGGGSHRCVVSESKPRAVSGITAWSLYHLIFISLLKCVAFFPPCTFGEEGNRSLPLSGWSNSTYCVFYLYMGYAAPYPCIE